MIEPDIEQMIHFRQKLTTFQHVIGYLFENLVQRKQKSAQINEDSFIAFPHFEWTKANKQSCHNN